MAPRRYLNFDLLLDQEKAEKEASARPSRAKLPVDDIESAVDDASGDDGWATLGMVGHVLVKRMPDFDPRNYGYKKLSDLVTDVASMEVRRDETPNGPSIMVRVKPVTSHGRR